MATIGQTYKNSINNFLPYTIGDLGLLSYVIESGIINQVGFGRFTLSMQILPTPINNIGYVDYPFVGFVIYPVGTVDNTLYGNPMLNMTITQDNNTPYIVIMDLSGYTINELSGYTINELESMPHHHNSYGIPSLAITMHPDSIMLTNSFGNFEWLPGDVYVIPPGIVSTLIFGGLALQYEFVPIYIVISVLETASYVRVKESISNLSTIEHDTLTEIIEHMINLEVM